MSKASDLEERLINFSVSVFTQTKNIANTRDYRSLVDQVRRSATSPALNYGEAQSAESTNDFIHKLGIVVKELRETQCLADSIQIGLHSSRKWGTV